MTWHWFVLIIVGAALGPVFIGFLFEKITDRKISTVATTATGSALSEDNKEYDQNRSVHENRTGNGLG